MGHGPGKDKTMLNKIEGRYGRGEKLMAEVSKAEEMVERYGWQERTVMPYSWPEKVTKLLWQCKQFYDCTPGSRDYLIDLWNGLADILNAWDAQEQVAVTVRILHNGKIRRLDPEFAEMLVQEGKAEYINQ